jgi:hypothetical protein
MSLNLSSSEFGSDNLTGQSVQHHVEVDSPLSLSKSTNTSVGRATAWRRPNMASYSAQTRGSTLNWDDSSSSTPMPSSDKGSKFLKD